MFGRLLLLLLNWLLSKKEVDIFDIDDKAPSDYPRHEISWGELVANLKEHGLELMLKDNFVPDYKVSYTGEDDWAKIIPYLVFPANLYVSGDADCDDYSKASSAKSAMVFKRNGCLQCWGDMPLGFHAFGLVVIGLKDYRLFEPNAGFPYAGKLFKNGEYGYIAKYWK